MTALLKNVGFGFFFAFCSRNSSERNSFTSVSKVINQTLRFYLYRMTVVLDFRSLLKDLSYLMSLEEMRKENYTQYERKVDRKSVAEGVQPQDNISVCA